MNTAQLREKAREAARLYEEAASVYPVKVGALAQADIKALLQSAARCWYTANKKPEPTWKQALQESYTHDCNELRHDSLPVPTFNDWAKAYRIKVWGL